MTLEKGMEVVHVPCPKGCNCDAASIHPNSTGVILCTPEEAKVRAQAIHGMQTTRMYYMVRWNQMNDGRTGVKWWTWDHAVMPTDTGLPDDIYLDGV